MSEKWVRKPSVTQHVNGVRNITEFDDIDEALKFWRTKAKGTCKFDYGERRAVVAEAPLTLSDED